MKRILWIFLSSIILLNAQAVRIEIKSDKDGIIYLGGELSNIRGMLETYAQIVDHISYKHPKEKLHKSLDQLDTLLSQLDVTYDSDSVIREHTKKARDFWAPVKKILLGAFDGSVDTNTLRSKTITIHNNIRNTIKSISAMKAHIIQTSKIKHSAEINAALEIGASARRMSAHYMMRLLNIDDPTIEAHYKNGLKIYEESLVILHASTFAKDPVCAKSLTLFERKLLYFKQIWEMEVMTPALVIKRGNTVFEKATELARYIK